jgi:hypothetical protein
LIHSYLCYSESYNKSVAILQKGSFQRNSTGKTAHKSDLSKKVIVLCVGHFWLHLTLETTRPTGKSNLVEKMQAGNYIRNLKKKIRLEMKILNFGCWPHFDHLTS